MLSTCKSWLKLHILMKTPKSFSSVQAPTIFFERMKTSVLPLFYTSVPESSIMYMVYVDPMVYGIAQV